MYFARVFQYFFFYVLFSLHSSVVCLKLLTLMRFAVSRLYSCFERSVRKKWTIDEYFSQIEMNLRNNYGGIVEVKCAQFIFRSSLCLRLVRTLALHQQMETKITDTEMEWQSFSSPFCLHQIIRFSLSSFSIFSILVELIVWYNSSSIPNSI